jgi:hypothetical protein
MTKTVDTRIAECVNIRRQLQSLGILTIPDISAKLTKRMNEFVSSGISQSFKLIIPDDPGTYVHVILSSNPAKQSGVSLVK